MLTGLYWGFYGPALALSRAELARLFKPYVMIGLVYLIIAILGGVIGMKWKGDSFAFTGAGIRWGFFAGSLGAFGALWLTIAMVSGGGAHPHVVMALVFGSAVTVSAIVGWFQTHNDVHTSPRVWIGIVVTVLGIIVTATNTPHAKPRVHVPARNVAAMQQ